MLLRLLFLLFLPCGPSLATEHPKLNLVIIAVDGLRADHLGLYGYPKDTSPHLDERAKQAVVFDRAVTQATWTLPSFTTLFTSLYPHEHGVLSHSRSVGPELTLLPEVLRKAGYRTAGFVGGHYLDSSFGLARGFDHYRSGGMGIWRFFSQTAPQAARWIKANRDKSFFVFVHGNDVHPPFDIPDEDEGEDTKFDPHYRGNVDSLPPDYTFVFAYNRQAGDHSRLTDGANPPEAWFREVEAVRSHPEDLRHLAAHYDDRIREADQQIEAVFAALKETGHDKDTIVVLLADHGLELGEKGKLATAFHLTGYDSVVHIPLILWIPGVSPQRVVEPVQLVDLAPTLLELLGLPRQPEFHGTSFAPLAKGAQELAPRFALTESSRLDDGTNRIGLYALQDRRWKLIYAPTLKTKTLFDLQKDPTELHDVSAKHPEIVSRLLKVLSERAGLSP